MSIRVNLIIQATILLVSNAVNICRAFSRERNQVIDDNNDRLLGSEPIEILSSDSSLVKVIPLLTYLGPIAYASASFYFESWLIKGLFLLISAASFNSTNLYRKNVFAKLITKMVYHPETCTVDIYRDMVFKSSPPTTISVDQIQRIWITKSLAFVTSRPSDDQALGSNVEPYLYFFSTPSMPGDYFIINAYMPSEMMIKMKLHDEELLESLLNLRE